MALELHIPPCIATPAHPLHPPPQHQPLRIQIEGPLTAIRKLLPTTPWHTGEVRPVGFPQPAGRALAELAWQHVYERGCRAGVADEMVVRDEYLGWVEGASGIDYYGVTFDHLVPDGESDPEVLQINIMELDNGDGGAEYADAHLLFAVEPAEYTGKKVLAVPRCCQKRRGTQDRRRVDFLVADRDGGVRGAGLES